MGSHSTSETRQLIPQRGWLSKQKMLLVSLEGKCLLLTAPFIEPAKAGGYTNFAATRLELSPTFNCTLSESRNRVQRRSSSPGYRQRRCGHKKVPPVSLRCLFAEGLEIEFIENGHAHRDEHEGVNRLGDPLDA